jgi:hypothetical protein
VQPFLFYLCRIMKRLLFILLFFATVLSGCTKTEPTRTAGIDKIDNIIYQPNDPFVYGFLFSTAKLVSSKSNPKPDITLYVNADNPIRRLTLQVSSLKPSFFKVGDFSDEAAAKSVFDNLKTVEVAQWTDMADPVLANQVWIFRTGNDRYAKIRIVSTVNEVRQLIPFGECTFQWVFQPDGSSTFPGK